MKILFLIAVVLTGCATRPVPRHDIKIKVISQNEFEMWIPGMQVSDVELEDGVLNPSDSKANYSIVFFKENDHFKGITKNKLVAGDHSKISFKIRSKDKTEIVHTGF